MELARNIPHPAAAPRRSTWHEIVRERWAYMFVAPFFILYAIFGLYPMLLSVYLSLSEWNGVGPIKFVGLANYARVLQDKVFWQSVTNGLLLFLLYVPAMLFLALVLAVLLNSKYVVGFRFFRALYFLPFITNMIAAGFAFRILLATNNGLFNIVLRSLGLDAIPWLETVWGARLSLALLIMWAWLGYNMVLMLAGLQTIPAEVNEAALIDGANPIQGFFYITVPLMRPMIVFTAVLSTIGSFGLFAEVAALTNGGPVNATITPLIRIFNVAFRGNFQLGYAAALSYTYFAIVFVLTLLQVRFSNQAEG
jgi:lactose/L-arabinose transport system permease protein